MSVRPSKCILYYTCNTHRENIEQACRRQLAAARGGCGLVSVSLKPIEFGDWNLVLPLERSPLTMHRQILAGLERIDADVVFLAESDVLYHPSHFELDPPQHGAFVYNVNVWKVRWPDGHAVWTDELEQVSGLCAYRDLLLDFYKRRVGQIERDGFNRHYEPGRKQTVGGKVVGDWMSEWSNVDIRHDGTLTRSKWSVDEFCNRRYAKGWQESDRVPGWGWTEGRMQEFLAGVPYLTRQGVVE